MNLNIFRGGFGWFQPKKKKDDPTKILVKVDSKGNLWYAMNDPLQMHVTRKLEMEDATSYLSMNLTREWVDEHVKLCEECINKGNIVQLAMHVNELKARNEMRASRLSLLHFCSAYYLINDEPNAIDPKYFQEKWDLLNSDPELQDFFLRDVLMRRANFTQDLQRDLDKFLESLRKLNKIDQVTMDHSLNKYTSGAMTSTNVA